MGVDNPFPSLLSLSDGSQHWVAAPLEMEPLSAQPATHYPVALLLIPAGSSSHSGTSVVCQSLAIFCFLLVITPTPLGNYGEEIQAAGVQERGMALLLLFLSSSP